VAEGVDSRTKFLEVNLTEKVIDQHPSHQKEYLFERNILNNQGNLANLICIFFCRTGLIMMRKLQRLLESMRLLISF